LSRWFGDLGVGWKIGIAVGACLLLMTVQGVNGLTQVHGLSADSAALYNQDAQGLSALGDARATINRMRQRVLLHVLAAPADKARRLGQIAELDRAYDDDVARLRPLGAVPTDQLDSWVAAVTTYRQYRDATILPASLKGVTGPELAQVLADCDRLFAPVEQGGLELSASAVAHAAARQKTSAGDATTTQQVMIVLLLLALTVGTALSTFATRMILRPLAQVRRVLDAMADGDLTQRAEVTSTDEVGRMAEALGRATTSVGRTLTALAQNAGSLAGASEELSANNAQISAAAQETASQTDIAGAAVVAISDSVRSVAAGAEEMSASIREIAQNASEAARVAAQAVHAAESANTQVIRLGESSGEIGNVIKVITSIAEQTNLLALNATIEAARAGSAGKGFAVVADEVKQLAMETARATGDIGQRVEAIQADTAAAITVIGEIAQIIEKINDYQTTIASAVEEQTATTNEMSQSAALAADSAQQVNANIAGVASAAATTNAGVQEAQQASSRLAVMSADLQGLVDQFRY
jgi:methyl-accepting chemotaxis protein